MNVIFFQNIRVMAKYYTRVRIKRMSELLDLTDGVSVIALKSLMSTGHFMSENFFFLKGFQVCEMV